MKEANVLFLEGSESLLSPDKLSSVLAARQEYQIDENPWPMHDILPKASFRIAYNDRSILIDFVVKERDIRSKHVYYNDPVYKDSCVEFFIAFDDDKAYYNFEFNCTGTCLAGYGAGRQRELLPFSAGYPIETEVRFKQAKDSFPDITWELSAVIPFEVFVKHSIRSLRGKVCRGNFYKCGDELPQPHYLTWSRIESKSPDFHLPEFFGQLNFQ